MERGRCVRFTYGGCQGNENNFLTKRDCEETCPVQGKQFELDKATVVVVEVIYF